MTEYNKYLDDDREIAVSCNVALKPEFLDEVRKLQQLVTNVYAEQRNYDTTPHIAIATKFMQSRYASEYVTSLLGTFTDTPAFVLRVEAITKASQGTYLFLDLDTKSKQHLVEMRATALTATKGIGYETPHNEPARYQYDPHISLVKLFDHSQLNGALKLLAGKFSPIETVIDSLYITKESRRADGYADFPVIEQIQLE